MPASLEAMLEARTVALLGASPRPGSLAERCLVELERSPGRPAIHLVNPRYAGTKIGPHTVLATLDDLEERVDLVLFAVGDGHLEAELARAARRGDRSGVVFGSAVDPEHPEDSSSFRRRLATIAGEAGMALCGGGCMGFVSPKVRALGYLEREGLGPGPIALVTHSGSAFSALLRTDRPFAFSLAVSSGQELVTTASSYVEYALGLEETRVVVLVLEALRQSDRLRSALELAAKNDVAVVALTVGRSAKGRSMVAAHSGALAGADGAFEALFDAHGVIRVHDIPELCDTVELLVCGRRLPEREAGDERGGLGAVLDSGAERALLADLADEVGIRFGDLSAAGRRQLHEILDPGLVPENPLDVWGRGAATADLFSSSLSLLASEEDIDAVALCVDLVTEYDGDDSYCTAVEHVASETDLPVCVLSHVPSSLDPGFAGRLRGQAIPVLEGTRTGLLALRHLFELREMRGRPAPSPHPIDERRRESWGARLAKGDLGPAEAFRLLADYGIASPACREVSDVVDAVAAARSIGFPVVMKTAGEISHKTESGGVILGISGDHDAAAAYEDLATRLGPRVLVAATAPQGAEISLGIVVDPELGGLVVIGTGGVLVELFSDRVVALPPIGRDDVRRYLGKLRGAELLGPVRGRPGADPGAVSEAIVAMSTIATELGGLLGSLEVNPLSCGPSGALALDVLVEI